MVGIRLALFVLFLLALFVLFLLLDRFAFLEFFFVFFLAASNPEAVADISKATEDLRVATEQMRDILGGQIGQFVSRRTLMETNREWAFVASRTELIIAIGNFLIIHFPMYYAENKALVSLKCCIYEATNILKIPNQNVVRF